MTSPVRLAALLAFFLAPWAAVADSGSNLGGGGGTGGGGGNAVIIGPLGTSTAPASAVSVSCVSGCQAGAVSNALGGQAATTTNIGAVSWGYAWNSGTSKWDQLQVDVNDSLITVLKQGAAALSATNGLYANLLQGNAVLSATNTLFSAISVAGAVQSATNGQYANLLQGNLSLSPTNGIYANLLLGNLAVSATNGLYTNLLQGNSVIGAGNPLFANVVNGIVGTNTAVACGTACMIGVQGNVTATDIPVSVAGTRSNSGSAVPSGSANINAVAYLYAYNGASYDQLQVDASKFLKINCVTGCGGSGAVSNSGLLAPSSTNVGSIAYLYAYNGANWVQGLADASGFVKVNCATGCAGGTISNAGLLAPSSTSSNSIAYLYAYNGTNWVQGLADGSGFVKVNCSAGCAAAGALSNSGSGVTTTSTNLGTIAYNYLYNGATWDQARNVSNAASAVASNALNVPSVSYNFGYNGATWDQLQVDANKALKVVPWQAGAALGTSNGIYSNILQGNAALSSSNGIYANLLQGNNVLSPSNPIYAGETRLVGATQTALHADPCMTNDWIPGSINFNTATTSTVITGTAAKKTYVCYMDFFVAGAVNLGIIEGTTATCGTGSAGIVGTNAATGYNFAANQGIVKNNGGHMVMQTATNADNLCFAFSAAVQVSGNYFYVQQ